MEKHAILSAVAAGIVAATCGLAAAASAASAPEPADVPDGFIATQSAFAAEYREARIALDFPEGDTWEQGDAVPELEPGAIAENGVAAGIAHHQWLCAWEGEYLGAFADGDASRAANALERVRSWEALPWVREHVVDPEGGWFRSVVVPAMADDPGGVEEDYAFGCEH
ncbi:hypothetical protein ROT00_05090 [Agromyces mediolanus]|uniref:hypothetical protein n=1 Tax=Agromyces mediolanus TaxID=41986 RepID=UPI0038393853